MGSQTGSDVQSTTTSVFTDDPTNPRFFSEVILGLVVLILSWLTIGARFLARYHIHSIGADDVLILAAQAIFTAYIITVLEIHKQIPGALPLSLERENIAVHLLIANEVLYAWCMIFVKLSLGMFFLRIIIQKHLRQAVYVIMVVSTLYNLFTAFWDIGLCGNPTNYVSNLMTGKCVPTEAQMALTYVHGAVNTLTDIAFACLPFILLRHSSLPQKIKVYIYFILGLSTIGCVSTIGRFFYIKTLYYSFANYNRAVSALGIISVVELSSAIMASSLSTLRPLIRPMISLSYSIRSTIFGGDMPGTGSPDGWPSARASASAAASASSNRGLNIDHHHYPSTADKAAGAIDGKTESLGSSEILSVGGKMGGGGLDSPIAMVDGASWIADRTLDEERGTPSEQGGEDQEMNFVWPKY